MKRAVAILGSLLFLVIALGTVALLVPWWLSRWELQASWWSPLPIRVLGGLLIVAGLPVLLDSFARFALQGLGTPAPILPPRHLVVTGAYRHVRNPMYVSLMLLIVGQGLLCGSLRVLEYGGIAWVAFHWFVVLYEEPTLRSTFGDEYEVVCANVPRWIPRLRPWN